MICKNCEVETPYDELDEFDICKECRQEGMGIKEDEG